MFFIILGVVLVFVVFRKVKIKWKTFIKKGFTVNRGRFGVYCYTGKQGKGKTYSVVEFLHHLPKDTKVYSNIASVKGVDYTYFNGFENLLELRNESNCVIIYDEIFTALTKSSKLNIEVLDFLSQMRKRKIVFLTTAQEWLEINITLRRYVRYQIDCNMFSIFGVGILLKSVYDAEQMTWDNLENEYVAPLIEYTVSKANKYIANSYDTHEQIKT